MYEKMVDVMMAHGSCVGKYIAWIKEATAYGFIDRYALARFREKELLMRGRSKMQKWPR